VEFVNICILVSVKVCFVCDGKLRAAMDKLFVRRATLECTLRARYTTCMIFNYNSTYTCLAILKSAPLKSMTFWRYTNQIFIIIIIIIIKTL